MSAAAVVRRKRLLVERATIALEWPKRFPKHDIADLRLISNTEDQPWAQWDESWAQAARAYHDERKHDRQPLSPCFKTFEQACDWHDAQAAKRPVDQKTKQLRRLLENDISIERAWAELNDPRNRRTPQVVVEAVLRCVRVRGVAAVKEPINRERLAGCDAAARQQINARIERLLGGAR